MDKAGNAKRFTAIGQDAGVHAICERHAAGEIPVCPRCGSDLVIAFGWEEANALGIHPGIVCPEDSTHFQALFNVSCPSRKIHPDGGQEEI